MAIAGRRKNETLLGRLWRAISVSSSQTKSGVVSEDSFQFELMREISRSNRRHVGREFAVIYLTFSDSRPKAALTETLLNDFRERVRISDTIGWHRSKLAILLPETNRDGAELVVRDLNRISNRHGKRVSTALHIYPWDESLVVVSEDEKDNGTPSGPWSGDHDFENAKEFIHDAEHSNGVAGGHRYSNGSRQNGSGLNGHGGIGHRDSMQGVSATGLHASGGNVPSSSFYSAQFADSSVGVLEPFEPNPVNRFAGRFRSRIKLGRRRAPKSIVSFDDSNLNRLASSISRQPTPWWKRSVDILGAGTGLLVLSPLFLGAAVAIKLSSPGPIFFRQMREGKDGKPFAILKFRTMVPDAEQQQDALRGKSEQDGPAFKMEDDPRVTRIGRYLRRSCADELPQLVNVLLGQMSLVGPRPLPVGESHACHAWQRMRLTVLPGLTCTWQIQGARRVKFEQWMRMDLNYIQNRSFLYDLKLIVRTALLALLHRGSA